MSGESAAANAIVAADWLRDCVPDILALYDVDELHSSVIATFCSDILIVNAHLQDVGQLERFGSLEDQLQC